MKSGDFAALADVARRYFHTQAGYEATWRIGAQRFDRGQFLAAALAFERLRAVPHARAQREPHLSLRTAICWSRIAMTERALATLHELPLRDGMSIRAGEREIPPFAPDEDRGAWLARHFGGAAAVGGGASSGDWPLFRGDQARIGIASLGSPGEKPQKPWRRSDVVDPEKDYADPGETETEARLRRMIPVARTDTNSLPARHPLVVGDLVFVQTLGTLRAMRIDTGETVWETMVDDTLSELLLGGGQFKDMPAAGRDVLIARLLDERCWKDLLHGTLSSDAIAGGPPDAATHLPAPARQAGHPAAARPAGSWSGHVYAIEGSGFATPFVLTNELRGPSDIVRPRAFNRLAAFDALTGRTVWKVGGAPSDEFDFVRPLAGHFFLGPPLPLGGKLYVLAEHEEQVRLLALDAQTGALEWAQTIAEPDYNISDSPPRRMAASSPSYADGVLVCPTGAGGLVAFELDTRSLLWAFQVADGGQPGAPPRRPPVPVSTAQSWNEPVPLIAERHVLFVPPTGDAVYCVGLLDGVLRWKHPRGDALALAGVSRGRVVIAGVDSVQALTLENGSPVWDRPAELSRGKPAGRGLLTEERLYLPLSTSQIAVFDLDTGRPLESIDLPPDIEPGNLLGARGTIISQGAGAVGAFALPPPGADR